MRSRVTVAVCLLLLEAAVLAAQQGAPTIIRVPVPEPHDFEVALDELWIHVKTSDASLAPRLRALDLTVASQRAGFVRVTAPRQASPQDLVALGQRTSGAIADSALFLALYEPGVPHGDATRALLSRQVALILQPGTAASAVAERSRNIRAVPGVANAYVLEADDPLASIALARELAAKPGVRLAYPLLRRMELPR